MRGSQAAAAASALKRAEKTHIRAGVSSVAVAAKKERRAMATVGAILPATSAEATADADTDAATGDALQKGSGDFLQAAGALKRAESAAGVQAASVLSAARHAAVAAGAKTRGRLAEIAPPKGSESFLQSERERVAAHRSKLKAIGASPSSSSTMSVAEAAYRSNLAVEKSQEAAMVVTVNAAALAARLASSADGVHDASVLSAARNAAAAAAAKTPGRLAEISSQTIRALSGEPQDTLFTPENTRDGSSSFQRAVLLAAFVEGVEPHFLADDVLNAEPGTPEGVAAAKALTALIVAETPSAEEQANMVARYNKSMDPACDLPACAACGISSVAETRSKFKKKALRDSYMLRVKPATRDNWLQHSYAALKWRAVHPMPTVEEFEGGLLEIGKWYHLRASLVHADGTFYVCGACYDSLRKQKIPKLSLANGVEFGECDQPLNRAERLAVTQVRLLQEVIKLVPSKGLTAASVGHCISFSHDAAMRSADVIRNGPLLGKGVLDTLRLVFLCPKRLLPLLKAAALTSKELYADSSVVESFLRTLHACHPAYAAVLSPTLTDDEKRELEELPSRIVASASEITDTSSVANDALTGADIAGVRLPAVPLDAKKEGPEDDGGIGEVVIVDHVAVVAKSADLQIEHATARAVASFIDVRVNQSTDDTPMSEFGMGFQELISRAFPYHFIFGFVTLSGGPMNRNELEHMMLQSHRRFSDPQLLLCLANMKQRHAAISTARACASSHPEDMKELGSILNDDVKRMSLLKDLQPHPPPGVSISEHAATAVILR
jgi:hypothetical protein